MQKSYLNNIVHIALVVKDTEWFTYAMFIKLCAVNRWQAGARNYFLGRVALTTTQATESSLMHESSAFQFSYNYRSIHRQTASVWSYNLCCSIVVVLLILFKYIFHEQ